MTALVVVALILAALGPVPPLLGIRSPAIRRGATALGVVGVVVAAIAAATTDPVTGFARGLCLVLGVVAAAVGAISLVPILFDIVRAEDDRTPAPDTTDAEASESPDPDQTDSVVVPTPLRGGRLIGVLERTAVAVAVLAGWPEGIAVVLAVKGLARYPEIRAAHAGEQFIIGTFGSVLWALAVAGTTHLAIR